MHCLYCGQDLASALHESDKYCHVCGQGIDDSNADIAALRAENQRLREALETALHWGIELGTTDPRWVEIARAALA